MCVDRIFVLDEGIRICIRKSEDILLAVAGDDVVTILRVEVLQLFKRRSCKLCYLLEVQLLVDLECVDMYRHLNRFRLDAVFLVVCHGVKSSYESRHITSCFAWKVWPYVPERTFSAASADRLVHIACAAVVRCDRKVPVAEDLICILKVTCRSIRRLERVHTLVHE